jgi:hypothetical protein
LIIATIIILEWYLQEQDILNTKSKLWDYSMFSRKKLQLI